jgi:hypothetical protein
MWGKIIFGIAAAVMLALLSVAIFISRTDVKKDCTVWRCSSGHFPSY